VHLELTFKVMTILVYGNFEKNIIFGSKTGARDSYILLLFG